MAASPFREFISDDHPIYKPEANRYLLYAAVMCPFAHRTLLARAVKKLEDIVPLIVLNSVNDPTTGWQFDPQLGVDPVMNAKYMKELYLLSKPDYEGRITVPVLFDTKTRTIVNNESSDIVRMFNTAFNGLLGPKTIDLYPSQLAVEIEHLQPWFMDELTFCVYKIGYAKTQEEYEAHIKVFFRALDRLEALLAEKPFVAGDVLTEADLKIFPWIARLPFAYEYLYKINLKSLRDDRDYPNTSRWLRKVYQIPGVAPTLDVKQIMDGNFIGQPAVNPSKLVPLYRGPDLTKPEYPLSERDFAWFN